MSKQLTKQRISSRDRSEQEYIENLKVLYTMMAHGNRSDRKIAKILGVCNTTLSRRRKKLEAEGFIQEYTLIPNLQKLGFEFIVFTFASTNDMVTRAPPSNFSAFLDRFPEIITIYEDQGSTGTSWVGISVHKSYEDFVEMFEEVQNDPSIMSYRPKNLESKVVVFRTNRTCLKQFSMRSLEIAAKKQHTTAHANHVKN